jgi:hypothetical protein
MVFSYQGRLLILWRLGTRQDLVAQLLVNLGFCRIRFWYPVAPGSGISRETSRIHFWNLTTSVTDGRRRRVGEVGSSLIAPEQAAIPTQAVSSGSSQRREGLDVEEAEAARPALARLLPAQQSAP